MRCQVGKQPDLRSLEKEVESVFEGGKKGGCGEDGFDRFFRDAFLQARAGIDADRSADAKKQAEKPVGLDSLVVGRKVVAYKGVKENARDGTYEGAEEGRARDAVNGQTKDDYDKRRDKSATADSIGTTNYSHDKTEQCDFPCRDSVVLAVEDVAYRFE